MEVVVASLSTSSQSGTQDQSHGSVKNPLEFDFSQFFLGHTRMSGWFSDRFGKPRRHFCGDFYGYNDAGQFILEERLLYTDGILEERVWVVSISDTGIFSARSDSLIGEARGFVSGNTLTMRYSMKIQIAESRHMELHMKDLMILQPDGCLHNITHVYKWGLKIGSVAAQYIHHDGHRLCIPEARDGEGVAKSGESADVVHQSDLRNMESVGH